MRRVTRATCTTRKFCSAEVAVRCTSTLNAPQCAAASPQGRWRKWRTRRQIMCAGCGRGNDDKPARAARSPRVPVRGKHATKRIHGSGAQARTAAEPPTMEVSEGCYRVPRVVHRMTMCTRFRTQRSLRPCWRSPSLQAQLRVRLRRSLALLWHFMAF